MANAYNNFPMTLDTDLVSYRATAPSFTGLRIAKIMLVVRPGGAATAGVVTITNPIGGANLYPPIAVGTQAANTVIVNDQSTDPQGSLTWQDFSVTGLTATASILYLWYKW